MRSSSATAVRSTRRLLGLEWLEQVTPVERRALIAGGLGWMLDAMDFMLLAMVLDNVMAGFRINKAAGGLVNSFALIASAVGGILFGFLADRIGRARSLMASILVYSLGSGACGLSATLAQLILFRAFLGLGMGGEWNTGATLVAETWRPEHRGRALGLMQSAWAIGEMMAAGVTLLVLPRFGWRAVFFVGVLPALVVFWIRRKVPEPQIWLQHDQKKDLALFGTIGRLWRRDVRWNGILATAMNACTMFGYWGLFTWVPSYLKLPVTQGGRGLGIVTSMTWLIIMDVGKWFGYISFGFLSDWVGRRKSYALYLLVAGALVPVYGMAKSPGLLLLLGPFVAFFGTGYFSGFGAIASELFPTEVRATAMGLSYNLGRGFSALAPFAVGVLAIHVGLGSAFFLQAAAFFSAAVLALALPETKGKQLE